jgi:hypothetical protein
MKNIQWFPHPEIMTRPIVLYIHHSAGSSDGGNATRRRYELLPGAAAHHARKARISGSNYIEIRSLLVFRLRGLRIAASRVCVVVVHIIHHRITSWDHKAKSEPHFHQTAPQ